MQNHKSGSGGVNALLESSDEIKELLRESNDRLQNIEYYVRGTKATALIILGILVVSFLITLFPILALSNY